MRLHHETVLKLTEALKQRRQFTMGEQMLAQEALTALRARALNFFSLPHTCSRATQEGDTAYVARLRQKGLYEIHAYAAGGASTDPPPDFILALVEEASRDFNAHASHALAQPPQVAMALRERSERAERALDASKSAAAAEATVIVLADRLAQYEAREEAWNDRLSALETRYASLATQLGIVDADAKKEEG